MLPVVAAKRPNVLFIANDDLRPMISGLGSDCVGMSRAGGCEDMSTPHFDAFLQESLVLTNSHVQVAVCSPSRTSLLYGRRPDTTHTYDLWVNAREVGCENCTTIPGLFKEAGYFTVGMGKIFHDGHASGGQDPQSWTMPEDWFLGSDSGDGECKSEGSHDHSWNSVDESQVGLCQDSQVREHALGWMRRLANGTEGSAPWFLAVGFRKPHLPFVCPQEFFEPYPETSADLAPNPFAPAEMPAIAYASYELQSYADVNALNFTGQINETLDDGKAAELVRAYKACLSYTDHNVGAVLGELKKLGQWESTIVIFWGDHGWKLGHHGAWAKHTNWREDTNSPMMLRIPGKTDGGVRSNALVDHVDVMATLVEAAGLAPLETCPEKEPWTVPRCTEGTSFLPLVASPERIWKNASFSQYRRAGDIMGYSMTLADSRFTAWAHFDASTNTSDLL
jgi:iduronate 2-sulfatase